MAQIAALLRFTYPRRLFARAISWNALTVALSFAAGPAIGAAILSIATWPWLFAVNIPVSLVVLSVSRALPSTLGTGRKLDWISVALNAGFFAPLIVGVDQLFSRPLAGSLLLLLSGTSLALLIRREMPRVAPLIPIDLLRVFPFRISVMASICCFAAQMAGLIALPFYLQHGLRQDTFSTGLYMTPWPLTVAVVAPFAGSLTNRIPTAWLCLGGGACFACGLALMALWPFGTSLAPLLPITMLAGLGFGLFQTPNNHNMLLSAPRERSGAAGATLATARLIGQTTGTVIMGVLFTLAPTVIAPRIGLAVGAALALAGGLVSTLRIPRKV
jgi:DHA2 family multidrug resistance protein-like MFS transporter